MVSGRRRFLLGITAPLALACGAAWPAQRVYRIGILEASPLDTEQAEVLTAELKRRGWEIDRNVVFIRRAATMIDPASMYKAARELVELKVDLILTYPGSGSALAALKATSTIPIVFFASSDPVGQGLVRSLARPGRNATGSAVPVFDVLSKNIQLLAEATGKLSKLAVLYTPESVSWPQYPGLVSAADRAGRDLGIAVRHTVVGLDVAQTLRGLVREGVDCVSIQGEGSGTDDIMWKRLADSLITVRLPSIGWAQHGFLLSYGFSTTALAVAAARYIDEIFRGANPASVPTEQVATFELHLNLRTASALGITIPQGLLLRATTLVQ